MIVYILSFKMMYYELIMINFTIYNEYTKFHLISLLENSFEKIPLKKFQREKSLSKNPFKRDPKLTFFVLMGS